MHEMSIAVNIVKIALEAADKEKAKKINSIEIDLGKLAGVAEEALLFCYDSTCKNTIAEGSVLKINSIPGQAFCEACNYQFEADQPYMICPQCGEQVWLINGGKELKVKSVNVD
ncbi:MAG: hydrogenase maturation nickel metallochaperone HypA [Calditrichaceae bacterium]|nr:hydrogenase maturation nickel metallochaperone HypA [Calditrichaceae bacterium]MBN2709896.1 hydrogenase maturation nickel metallochaperone HypA [Calditrichaceae bacterium]RQV92652.1 MAG: hydrogenase maturation nickel metallochaperone HypA [Calditrichota bacterium]